MLFDSWAEIGRVLAIGVLAYGGLVFLLRISGKRTLSKMNAFDLIVTVALGSTLATVLLSKDVALAEGLTAFALLIFLQYAITWTSVRSKRAQRMVKAQPCLLAWRGALLDDALRRERVAAEEILAAIRAEGMASVRSVDAVVLETDGSFTVIPAPLGDDTGALEPVIGVEAKCE